MSSLGGMALLCNELAGCMANDELLDGRHGHLTSSKRKEPATS
jgi:hypothetical protein